MSPDLTRTARGPAGARRRNTAQPRRIAVAVAAVLVIATACGGGGDESDGPAPTSAPTTTTAAVTSTTPPTTTAPTIAPPTDPPVTDPPATDPPATLDVAALEAQIRADFERTVEVRRLCGQSPATCEIGDIAVPGSPEYRGLVELMATRIAGSLAARPDSGPFNVRIESVAFVDDDTAEVVACITDGLVLVDTRGTTDMSDDIIFDDSVGSARSRWTMRLVDRWLRLEGEFLGQFPGATGCD